MEIPTSTHPGLISKSQTEEKARFTTAINKITSVVNLVRKLYGKSRLTKFIRTDYSTYKLTQSPVVILDNIKINHPLVKLMSDYVKKLDSMGDSSPFFMILIGNILEEVLQVLDKGVKVPILSEILHEVSTEIFELTRNFCEDFELINNGRIDPKSLNKVLDGLIKEPITKTLLTKAIITTKGFNTENIRICKVPSGSLKDSRIINGMIFEREPEGKIKKIENGITSIFNASIDVPRGELKSTVQLESADQLSRFSKDEVVFMKKKIEGIKSDVIIFSGRINEIYLDLLNGANKLVFKVLSKHDLRRLRELLGGSISQEFSGDVNQKNEINQGEENVHSFNQGEENVHSINQDGNLVNVNFNQGENMVKQDHEQETRSNQGNVKEISSNQGYVKEISVITQGNRKYTQFITEKTNFCSIILRHPLEYRLDELERTIIKALEALQRNVRDKKIGLCSGSGQFEVRMGDIFTRLAKESLEKYNEGEDLLDKHLVYESLSNVFKGFGKGASDGYDIYATKARAVCYALEFVGTVFEIEDYLIGLPPKLNVRPQMNQNWDEDH